MSTLKRSSRGGDRCGFVGTKNASDEPCRNRVGPDTTKCAAGHPVVWRQQALAIPSNISPIDGIELSDLLGVEIEESESSLAGAYPDGGIFWHAGHPGKVLCVAEAKKQGERGNAIERWFKNYSIMRRLGCEIYLTVCTGDGFFNGNRAQKTLETAVATDPFDFYRLRQDAVWNQQEGSIWLYRFRDAAEAASFDLTGLMQDAIAESLRRTKYREAQRP